MKRKKGADIKLKRCKNPPKTERYCESCKKLRQFIYDRIIGHSVCEWCGNRNIRVFEK